MALVEDRHIIPGRSPGPVRRHTMGDLHVASQTYIWGTVGIILITKYLPKWWGVDARAAAREYEKEHGVASGDTPALSGWTTGGLRAYQLENQAWQGRTIGEFLREHRE